MTDRTYNNRLLRVETESDWNQIPYLIDGCSWHGDRLFVAVGKGGHEGYCHIDKPDSFPCNIYIQGYNTGCRARIISDRAAIAYLHDYSEKTLNNIKDLQYEVKRYLQIERKISGFSTPFYPDDYEMCEDSGE